MKNELSNIKRELEQQKDTIGLIGVRLNVDEVKGATCSVGERDIGGKEGIIHRGKSLLAIEHEYFFYATFTHIRLVEVA